MQTYLVTTDLSEESKAAFGTAAAYARRCQARIVLLAVIEDAAQAAMLYAMEFPVSSGQDVQKQFQDKVFSELEVMAGEFFQGIDCQIVVIESSKAAAVEIAEYGAKHRVDLIIMSTRGKSGITRLLTGSVTIQVLREAASPVLVVPVRTPPQSSRPQLAELP